MDYRKLDELNKLRLSGALTDEEFEREKQKLFAEEAKYNCSNEMIPMGLQENSYLALMNFLILIPYVGWLIPIILWALGKNASVQINSQGKYILNWYITWFIFGTIFVIAAIVSLPAAIISCIHLEELEIELDTLPVPALVEGVLWLFPIIVLAGLACLAFPIIGGIKGMSGQAWKYPLSIPFLK